MMDETDAELVQEARRGSREAAGGLVRRYLRACRSIALSIVGEVAEAEDAAQDAMVYALAHIHECREPSRFGAWLRQIVRSNARNRRRDASGGRVLPLDADSLVARDPSPALQAERSDLGDRLLAAITTLPEERREVVLLHDLEGWTHREIAERMELPEGTVRSHLHLARKALRALLGSLKPE